MPDGYQVPGEESGKRHDDSRDGDLAGADRSAQRCGEGSHVVRMIDNSLRRKARRRFC